MALDTTNALVSLAEAKTFLKITASSEDSVIEDFINRASIWANDYTGRLLKSRANTDYYDGNGGNVLSLNQYPVTTLTSLNDDTDRVFGSGTAINVSTDVILNTDAGIVTLFNQATAFSVGTMNIKVVYTAGYTTAPETVKEAVLLYVGHIYRRQYADQKFGVQSETIGDRTTTYSTDDFVGKAKALLNPYRSERVLLSGF